jgi:hypothetical protein
MRKRRRWRGGRGRRKEGKEYHKCFEFEILWEIDKKVHFFRFLYLTIHNRKIIVSTKS